MNELEAAYYHRLASAPVATRIRQSVGCARDMNWPHSANAAWDRAHPEASVYRGPSPVDVAVGLCIPALWPGIWFRLVAEPWLMAMESGR